MRWGERREEERKRNKEGDLTNALLGLQYKYCAVRYGGGRETKRE